METINIKDIDELKDFIKKGIPAIYTSSQTSTVIPYDKLDSYIHTPQVICSLSNIKGEMELLSNTNLKIKGAVSWREAKEFLKERGRNIKTSPTEELALILAGAATSATGERCFHFGNLRNQIKRIKYIDFMGLEKELFSKKLPPEFISGLSSYQEHFKAYESFKNGPYPRFELETDLMIGTEGQLGVITEVEIETCPDFKVKHLFILTEKWEINTSQHEELISKIQNFREDVILCELIDSNALSYLKEKDFKIRNQDAVFLEIKEEKFEDFYEHFILKLTTINEENIFEISEKDFHHIRKSVPRAVFEKNTQMGVIKVGTDIQVRIDDFKKLMELYQDFSKLGISYNLFGHFGDAHLHFNFMPTKEKLLFCQEKFEELYHEVKKLKGSPFAEHGIGYLKRKYIKDFHSEKEDLVFRNLKNKFDPKRQFFPDGFMNV